MLFDRLTDVVSCCDVLLRVLRLGVAFRDNMVRFEEELTLPFGFTKAWHWLSHRKETLQL